MSSAHVENANAGHTTGYDAHRLHTHDMEIGVTEAVQRHVQRHVVPPKPVTQRKLDFEHARPRWMREMAAEALGVFFYVCSCCTAPLSFFICRFSLLPNDFFPRRPMYSFSELELMCFLLLRSIPESLPKRRSS